jgi:ABC-type branched-subunit amino acid transport system substrate-binding protein
MNASVEGSSPYFFTVGHTVESQEAPIRQFFAANRDIKTIYDICWNDNWGKAHVALIHKLAAEAGVSIVGDTCTSDFSDDYRDEAAKVKAADPDAVFVVGSAEDVATKALSNLHIRAKILTTTGIVEAVMARDFPVEYTRNVWFLYWSPDQKFIQDFQAKFGKYPIMEAQNSYEAIRSIAAALKNNPSDVLTGLHSVSYETVEGHIDFTRGDHVRVNTTEARLYQFNDDKSFREIKS